MSVPSEGPLDHGLYLLRNGTAEATYAANGMLRATSVKAALDLMKGRADLAYDTVNGLTATATTIPAGGSATVTISGPMGAKVINIGVPRGRDGMGYAEGQQLLADTAAAKTAAQAAVAAVAPAAVAAAAPSVTAAQDAAADADAARVLAEQAQAAALEVPDANVSALIGNDVTETAQAGDARWTKTADTNVVEGVGTVGARGSIVKLGRYATNTRPTGVNLGLVAGGGVNTENVVGGNEANVNNFSASNLDGAPTLTGQNGLWDFILSGYDNVVNGWATVMNGFHNKSGVNSNHVTIAGGSLQVVADGVGYGTIGGGTGNYVSGASATIAGGQNNTASGSTSTVSGGNTNTAGGTRATVGGGYTNKATANQTTIAGGDTNTASTVGATVGGGLTNTASGQSSTIAGGANNTASGYGAGVPSGTDNTAAGRYSVATGKGAVTDINGARAHGAMFATPGDAQHLQVLLRRQVVGATSTDLYNENSQSLVIPEHTTWAVTGTVVGRRTDADDENAAWSFSGIFKRNAGNTAAWVGAPSQPSVTPIGPTNAWALTVTSASSGALRVNVVGEAGKTVLWVATLSIAHVAG